jgi:hypothetical protein
VWTTLRYLSTFHIILWERKYQEPILLKILFHSYEGAPLRTLKVACSLEQAVCKFIPVYGDDRHSCEFSHNSTPFNMKALCSSETLGTVYKETHLHIPRKMLTSQTWFSPRHFLGFTILGAISNFKCFNTGKLIHMLGEVISHLACAEGSYTFSAITRKCP